MIALACYRELRLNFRIIRNPEATFVCFSDGDPHLIFERSTTDVKSLVL